MSSNNDKTSKQHQRLPHSSPEVEEALLEFEKKQKNARATQKRSSPKKARIIKAPDFNQMIRRRHPMMNSMIQKTTFYPTNTGRQIIIMYLHA